MWWAHSAPLPRTMLFCWANILFFMPEGQPSSPPNKRDKRFASQQKEDPDSYSKKLLMTTLNALTNAKKATERLITKAQSIASHYVRSITEIQAILVTFDNDCWYDRFSSIVEEYILHRTDLKSAQKIFSEMAPKINIYRDKIPSLQSTVYRLKDLNI